MESRPETESDEPGLGTQNNLLYDYATGVSQLSEAKGEDRRRSSRLSG